MTTTTLSRRPFGGTGFDVAPVGFGGAPVGLLDTAEAEVGRLLNGLLDAGVDVIDTAAVYLESEPRIGRTIGHRRDEYVLVSKCGPALDEIDAPAWSAELVSKSIDRSLRLLRTDHLDVILLHSCDLETLRSGEALGAAVAARDAGRVRHVGYSGDNEAAAWAVAQDDVEVLQTSVSICDQQNIDAVLPAARANGVAVMAKRPIANAAWKSIEQQYEDYRKYAEPYHERFAAMGLSRDALGFDGSWPELALRFTLSIPGVHVAICGTTRPEHAMSNLAAAAKGPLPDATVEAIRHAFRSARGANDWPGLT